MRSPRVKFAWYDVWVGFFYDRRTRTGYLCPLPMVRIRLWGRG